MATLDIDFEDVPDKIVPIESGIYDLEIFESPTYEETKDKKSMKLVVKMKVVSDGQAKDRQLTDNISIKMETKIKRLIKAAGLVPVKNFDTNDLTGKIVKAKVTQRPYKDPQTGEERQVSNVDDYLFEEVPAVA